MRTEVVLGPKLLGSANEAQGEKDEEIYPFSLLLCGAGSASAALVWIKDLTIESYTVATSGSNYFLLVKVNEDISGAGCVTTDDQNQFARWSNSVSAFWDLMQSSIIAAETQGRKISIPYDNTQCSTEGGCMLAGITVLPEPGV